MARRRRRSGRGGVDSRISEIVAAHVDDLVNALSAEIRRIVGEEASAYFSGGGGGTVVAGRRSLGRARKKRLLQCIAPGCTNTSKGPRFHYLCDKHKDAKKADYEAWRKNKRDKAAA